VRDLGEAACIVGVGETDYSRRSGRSPQTLAMQAVTAALRDAGVAGREVDGVIPYFPLGVSAEEVASCLGVTELTFTGGVQLGGAGAVSSMRLAALALAAGVATNVVVFVARNGRSGAVVSQRVQHNPGQQFRHHLEAPFGWVSPAQWYAMMCRRHMHLHGTTRRQLGHVALTMRANAQRNERAMMFGRPMTMDDYLASETIADPYRKLDCCLETDGAAAIVLTTPERAADLPAEPVRVCGIAEGRADSPDDLTNRRDLLSSGLRTAAPRAFGMAGIGPGDVDAAMIYDCFTFEVIHQLEEAGFVPPGEGGAFVADGGIGPDGRLPVNPHGGLLSEGHLLGMNHIVEAVRQLRGEAAGRQLPQPGHIAVTGWGNLCDGSLAVLRGGGS
jgi:acetyl-CoA acetyltransferase